MRALLLFILLIFTACTTNSGKPVGLITLGYDQHCPLTSNKDNPNIYFQTPPMLSDSGAVLFYDDSIRFKSNVKELDFTLNIVNFTGSSWLSEFICTDKYGVGSTVIIRHGEDSLLSLYLFKKTDMRGHYFEVKSAE